LRLLLLGANVDSALATPTPSTPAQRRQDFARQRQLAARVSQILQRATALPASLRRAPLKLVDQAEAISEKMVNGTRRPWTHHDMRGVLRGGHDRVWLSSASGRHTLRLRFASENLVRGASQPGAPSQAELSFTVERQNPLARAHGVINELEKRIETVDKRVEVYTGGQYYGERPWRDGPAAVIVTRSKMHKSGLQRVLIKEARAQPGGAWLVETRYQAYRRNPVTGKLLDAAGPAKKHYDLHTPGGNRQRLTAAEGQRRWNLIE